MTPGSASKLPLPRRWQSTVSFRQTQRGTSGNEAPLTPPASMNSRKRRSTTSSLSPRQWRNGSARRPAGCISGLTSSDVLDTALAIQLRDACTILLTDLDALANAVRTQAEKYRRTPMIGRTHGVHAEPITFGLKLALWYAELQRDRERVERAREVVSVGKISGAVGTYAHLDPLDRTSCVCATRTDPTCSGLTSRPA